jgi:DMSO/TMAO reductase YedYZ molybdopterin-dependent catalytic subunit
MIAERTLLRAAARLVDAAVARLETPAHGGAAGDLARRDFRRAGGATLATALLAACDSRGPDGARRWLRAMERRNETVERWIQRHTRMGAPLDRVRAGARDAGAAFPSYHISRVVPRWDAAARGPWALEVTGLVARPMRLSLDALVRLPQTRQRVNHYCVEGWTAVATWWGVGVRELARVAGALPAARYVDFQSFDDGYHESWDLESALHPQTLVAYAMDGRFLSPAYGAPARLHSPVKLGYKSTKYLTRVAFLAERNGGYWSDQGYEWFAGT